VFLRGFEYMFNVLDQVLKDALAGADMGGEEFERRLDGYESMNLEENMMVKVKSLQEAMYASALELKQAYMVLMKRMANLYFLLRIQSRQLK
jgi:hypothetical protein